MPNMPKALMEKRPCGAQGLGWESFSLKDWREVDFLNVWTSCVQLRDVSLHSFYNVSAVWSGHEQADNTINDDAVCVRVRETLEVHNGACAVNFRLISFCLLQERWPLLPQYLEVKIRDSSDTLLSKQSIYSYSREDRWASPPPAGCSGGRRPRKRPGERPGCARA